MNILYYFSQARFKNASRRRKLIIEEVNNFSGFEPRTFSFDYSLRMRGLYEQFSNWSSSTGSRGRPEGARDVVPKSNII